MKNIIRWGILGTGWIAHKFAEGLKHVPNAKLIAIGSRNLSSAQSFATQYGAQVAYGSYRELAECPDIDVVYIATPHVYHYENTLLCLDNNKAVLCEKPFAMDSTEVAKMISKAKDKNLFLMEALWTRFLPSFLKALEIVQSGKIGEIIHVRSDFGIQAPYNLEGRLFNKKLGGGSLLDIGIYPVFLALTVLGKPDQISSTAVIGKSGIDESIAINFSYNNGAIASLYSTFMAHTATETQIFGTRGYIKLPKMWHMTNEIIFDTYDEGYQSIRYDYPAMGYEFEAREVTNCILEGKTESEIFSLQNSIMLMQILDEIRCQNKIEYN